MPDEMITDDMLTPSQGLALQRVETALETSPYVALVARTGTGKTVIARLLAQYHDAAFVDFRLCLESAVSVPLDRWNERVIEMIEQHWARADMLILDDFDWLMSQIDHVRPLMRDFWQRLCDLCERTGKRLVMVGRSEGVWAPHEVHEEVERSREARVYGGSQKTPIVVLPPFLTPEDMKFLAMNRYGDAVDAVDFEVIYTRVAQLTPRQFFLALDMLESEGPITTRTVARVVASLTEGANVDLGDVELVTFDLLPGSEEIAHALETHVAMPFENPEEAAALGFKARRGVMLFGPPGTGKTSIGRALAHRLKSKFFLIDGSIPTEPPHVFSARIEGIIDRAVKNAPSVLFIDDADSLFAIPYVAGFIRKLLSLMDGVESAAASNVCVMMTVMDPSRVPDALLRSGRVELWLETFPPDEATRARIFGRWASAALGNKVGLDCPALAARSAGFTPADIRRVIEDAKLFHARDMASGRPPASWSDYALRAVDEVVGMRAKMATVLRDKSLRVGTLLEMAA